MEQVLRLHQTSLDHFGGMAGVRDQRLLEAAVAMPQASYGGELLHSTAAAIAAAYLYHLAMSHAFLDGNKRTACFAAMVFLDANGIEHDLGPKELEQATWSVAAGEMGKDELTQLFTRWLEREAR
jgi:death-on-curing protein